MSDWTRDLRRLGACAPLVKWAQGYPDFRAAWAACERGDWMLWIAGRVAGEFGSDARRPLVLASCECDRIGVAVWERKYPDDRRPRVAIEIAEAWARGDSEVTLDMVLVAAAAAAAAYATDYAATYSAFLAYSADAAERARALREHADIVRKHYPQPPEIGAQP